MQISPTRLLEQARQQLAQPFANQQRKLLLYINVTYIFLTPIYLITTKVTTGYFVPHWPQIYIYLLIWLANLYSGIYNILLLKERSLVKVRQYTIQIKRDSKIDSFTRWSSVLSIMVLAVMDMSGYGNPSNDTLFADYAFGHSLIVLAAVLLGRQMAVIWTVIVISLLVYMTINLGYNYKYNYLTSSESARYEKALTNHESQALKRQRILQQEGLNPPTVGRYFNEWLVFILVAFLTAYYFMNISLTMLDVIPTVTHDLANAIESVNQQEYEREREKNLQEEQKMLLKQESLQSELNFLKSQLNPHFLYNTLYYLYVCSLEYSDDLAESLLKVSDIMRYSLREDSKFVLVQEEITYLKDFISLHQMRNKNKLYIDFTVNSCNDEKVIIPFILISLVENAFKHGRMDNKDFPITINIDCNHNHIEFYMKNQKGHAPAVDSTRIGLANIQRRLELTYPSTHTFKIEQDDDSFSCWLSITV